MFYVLNKICECIISIYGLKGHAQLFFDVITTPQNIFIGGENVTVDSFFDEHFNKLYETPTHFKVVIIYKIILMFTYFIYH